MAHRGSRTPRSAQSARRRPTPKWSAEVTRRSNALDLENEVFGKRRPEDIAKSLKSSAEHSTRRKSEPYRSAMSMLTFYVNRAGKNLPASRKKILQNAKDELRKLYAKKPTTKRKAA